MKACNIAVTILTPRHPDDLTDLFEAEINCTLEQIRPLNASDMWDNEENMVRLAEQVVRCAFRKLREAGK